MGDAEDLVEKAQRQLDEHKKWLADEIEKLPLVPWQEKYNLANRALEIKLRVAKAAGTVVSVVYEYPDELVAFLRSDLAPPHLRASIASGHVLDPNQPTFTARREDPEPKP